MKTVNVNKKALGPTLAKDDNDGKAETIDIGDHCNGGVIDGGAGTSCRKDDWEGSLTVKPDGTVHTKITKHNYGC